MTRRDFLATALASQVPSQRPNIVLMMADDLGVGDLSSYGCPDIRTPVIDGIGRRGVRFTQFYANAPECTPTRTALLTGRYQQRVGGLECAIGVGEVGRYDEAEWLDARGELGLPSSETSMGQLFKAAGYDTGCFGKWHLGYREKFSANAHGFDEYLGILGGNADYFLHHEQDGGPVLAHNGKLVNRKGYLTDIFVDSAIDWLKRTRSRPFFLYVPFTAPHTPIQAPDNPTVRNGHRPTYARMVEHMDKRIGDLLKHVPEQNTIVLFLSDNGADANGRNAPFRGRKSSVWEGGIRAPLLVRWPGVLPEGREVHQLGITMDLLPSLLAAASVAPPSGRKFDGVNLLPGMQGNREPFSRTLFWRYKRGEARRKAVRDGDWKLVQDGQERALHNLAKDPAEERNVISQETKRVETLQAKLEMWEKEVQAPRLREFRASV
jgi:arylsulfatase A-like enzyme